MDFVYAALGLTILLLAGDALVRSAVNVAIGLRIPALVVSLTIVSFGTSAPEMFISTNAVLDDAPGIALGNVVGSNISNVLLVLGLSAMISGIDTRISGTARSFLFMVAATVAFVALCFLGPLTWMHGLLLLGFLTVVTYDQLRRARHHQRDMSGAPGNTQDGDLTMSRAKLIMLMVIAFIGLPLGADLLVDSAVNIASAFRISESVIGLTLVAVGTSLPELATTVVAAVRRRADVVLGNVIGSNIFNLLAIIGVSSLLGTIPVDRSFLHFNLWVLLAVALIPAPFVLSGHRISRIAGAVLVALYLAYVTAILI